MTKSNALLSTLSPQELMAIATKHDSTTNVRCTLFPTRGTPLAVDVPIHVGYEHLSRPLDVASDLFVDNDEIHHRGPSDPRSFVALVSTPPESSQALARRYAVFFSHYRQTTLSNNEHLESLLSGVTIKGNVLVVQYNADFRVEHIDEAYIRLYEYIAATTVLYYAHRSQYAAIPCQIRTILKSWPVARSPLLHRPTQPLLYRSPLKVPELIDRIARFVPFEHLSLFSSLCTQIRVCTQVHVRKRIQHLLSGHLRDHEFLTFLAFLHRTRALVVGAVPRLLLTNQTTLVQEADLMVDSENVDELHGELQKLGYGKGKTYLPRSWTADGTGRVTQFTRDVSSFRVIESRDFNVFATLFRSGNSLQFNAISSSTVYSFFPFHVLANTGFSRYQDADFISHNPHSILSRSNATWFSPCGIYCPKNPRKTLQDPGALTFYWNTPLHMDDSSPDDTFSTKRWGFTSPTPSPPPDPPCKLEDPDLVPRLPLWEDWEVVVYWKLWSSCSNPFCPHYDLDNRGSVNTPPNSLTSPLVEGDASSPSGSVQLEDFTVLSPISESANGISLD
ncbi:hypothetical protein CC1G_01476 [Coprinopsis cinerea okayama7|uniref:Uncharacterized protein n=1 Tax=Coprinopsis cinerea (strain Okayama-7 / 130 / ATCC MYA-4618 / FGSC 9003) TaxID=240176 RepID=A8NYZ1_COPC7|nr:hypothetical protein CC1G_01476 [Coprinopsis cinerea okayama7\|eukprot:XP_001837564.2 hypothetical protein CC1G_01476 [Coprinopsis cinerea okayama7\